MKVLILTILISSSCICGANILVLEYEVENDDHVHGSSVKWIACRDSMQTCHLQYFNDLSSQDVQKSLVDNFKISKIVNMSFTMQKPVALGGPLSLRDRFAMKEVQKKIEEATKSYNRDSKHLQEIIALNSDQLFIAAAGNGVAMEVFHSKGLALKKDHQLYPQVLEYPHLLKVAALNIDSFNIQTPIDYEITEYSNYGLLYVELAAPVESNYDGEFIDGSSFAAPYVSRVAEEILEHHPQLNPAEVRDILIRSCHIKNISKALWATSNLLENKRESVVWKAMFHEDLKIRLDLQKQYLNDITLVQCGGSLSRTLALSCADNYAQSTYRNVDEACLATHRDLTQINEINQKNLKKLWKLRFESEMEARISGD